MDDDDDLAEFVERWLVDYLSGFSVERLQLGAERIGAAITPQTSDLERDARLDVLRLIGEAKRRQINRMTEVAGGAFRSFRLGGIA